MAKPCAARKGVIGREDIARMFVLYAVGTNADRRFARACPREELPSFAIGLPKIKRLPRRALKSLKKRDFDVGFVVIRFFR